MPDTYDDIIDGVLRVENPVPNGAWERRQLGQEEVLEPALLNGEEEIQPIVDPRWDQSSIFVLLEQKRRIEKWSCLIGACWIAIIGACAVMALIEGLR